MNLEDRLKELKASAIKLGKGLETTLNQVQDIKDALPEDQRRELEKQIKDDENIQKAEQAIKDFKFDI